MKSALFIVIFFMLFQSSFAMDQAEINKEFAAEEETMIPPLENALEQAHFDFFFALLETIPQERQSYYCNLPYGQRCKTPLHFAVDEDRRDVVKVLVAKYHVDVEKGDGGGKTPLHCAASYGNVAMIDDLIGIFNASVNGANASGETALHFAAFSGEIDAIAILAGKYHANTEARTKCGNFTPLHYAAKQGDIEVINELIIMHKADLEALSSTEMSALDIVIEEQRRQAIKVLLSLGAYLQKNKSKKRGLGLAIGRNELHSFLLDLILNRLPSRENVLITKIAYMLARKDFAAFFKLLESLPVEKQKKLCLVPFKSGKTPLHEAAESGNIDALTTLLYTLEVCPILRTRQGLAPLHYAAAAGHTMAIRLLAEGHYHCANIRDESAKTPLHYATIGEHPDTAHALIFEYNADVNAQDKYGWTSLHYAARQGNSALINALAAAQANINMQTITGDTPLHIAASAGNAQAIKILVEKHSAAIETLNKYNQSPLDIAIERANYDAVIELLSLGAYVCKNNKQQRGLKLAANKLAILHLLNTQTCTKIA